MTNKRTTLAQQPADVMTLDEAAAYARVGRETLHALYERGELPGVSLTQRHAVVLRADLDAWLAAKAREQQQARRAGGLERPPAPASARKRRRGEALPELET